MNIRRAACFFTLSIVPLLGAAGTGIEFSGVLTAGGKTRLALTDTANRSSTWVEPGDEFKGYTIARYDPEEDAIFVTKGGQETRIGLVASKTPEPASRDEAASERATAAAIRSNLQRLASAARQYQIQQGVNTTGYPDLVGPDKLIKELRSVDGEDYSTLTFGENVTGVSVTTANGATIAFDLLPASIAGSNATPATPASPPTNAANPSGAAAGTPAGEAPAAPRAPTAAQINVITEPLEPTGRQAVSPSYMIQGGDTWEKISSVTGVPVSRLKEFNPAILEGSALPAGQTIRVR